MSLRTEPHILVIGADASLRIAISKAFEGGRHTFLANAQDEAELFSAGSSADAIVVHCSNRSRGLDVLRSCAQLGLQRKTVALADGDDRAMARNAVALGIAGYVARNTDARRLMNVIDHIARGGVFLDGAAADAFGSRIDLTSLDPEARMSAARSLAYALEMKDAYTGGHAERVADMAMRLAAEACLDGAMPDEVLETAFLLHDVGKIGIPETILGKPARLDPAEQAVMQTHPVLGEKVVGPLDFPPQIRAVVRHHHERWDGRGYPDGLIAHEIPPAARLFAIADALDAMTSVRPYREPVSWDEALEEVLASAGTHFDPRLAALAHRLFQDGPSPIVEAQ